MLVIVVETVIHEFGHYFGLSEEEIEAIEDEYWNSDDDLDEEDEAEDGGGGGGGKGGR